MPSTDFFNIPSVSDIVKMTTRPAFAVFACSVFLLVFPAWFGLENFDEKYGTFIRVVLVISGALLAFDIGKQILKRIKLSSDRREEVNQVTKIIQSLTVTEKELLKPKFLGEYSSFEFDAPENFIVFLQDNKVLSLVTGNIVTPSCTYCFTPTAKEAIDRNPSILDG